MQKKEFCSEDTFLICNQDFHSTLKKIGGEKDKSILQPTCSFQMGFTILGVFGNRSDRRKLQSPSFPTP